MPTSLEETQKQITENFREVDLIVPPTPGPYEAPLSLPVLYGAQSRGLEAGDRAGGVWGIESIITGLALKRGAIRPGHCWLYVLRLTRDGEKTVLECVIAQGAVEDRSEAPPPEQE